MLASDYRHEPHGDFPFFFDISWRACLPHARGVGFGAIAGAGEAHKFFNGDEISFDVGVAIHAAIDAQVERLEELDVQRQRILEAASFLKPILGESEEEAHQRLLHEVERRLGRVVVACLCGSRRYNLHFVDSDRDLLVVYVARDATAAPAVIKNAAGLHPDYTVVEVGRFVQMLLDCDPRIVESLFLEVGGCEDERVVLCCAPLWHDLVALRSAFLCRELVRKYISDATNRGAGLGALRRGAKQEKYRKILYIAFRTLGNAMEVCRGQALQLWRSAQSGERAFIMALRCGEGGGNDDLLARGEQFAEEVQVALEVSDLRHKPVHDILEPWLSELRSWARGDNCE